MLAVWISVFFVTQGLGVQGALKLASYYGDHMVLQRGPQSAVVWGHASKMGDTVTVTVTDATGNQVAQATAKVTEDPAGSEGIWKVKLPSVKASTSNEVKVESSEGTVTLNDVAFGDVWVCSGQSNMAFVLKNVINGSEEVAAALKFKDIRILQASRVESTSPLEDLSKISIPWTQPTESKVGSFSAVCFLFAEYLSPYVNVPIGLVESDWGGTPIEAWSSPDALKKCQSSAVESNKSIRAPGDHSVLWNGMISPLLSMTISGALWYQGEANAGRPDLYACQFPAMIADWRQKFHDASMGETAEDFPFGFVQLAPNARGDKIGGFPPLRWAQTAKVGRVPNAAMPRTFMAVAMDLPDYDAPTGSIHPRYKQDVAARLVLGARAVALGDTSVTFEGPFPRVLAADKGNAELTITYDHGPLDVRSDVGFEVCCATTSGLCGDSDTWSAATVKESTDMQVVLDVSACTGQTFVGSARYEWRESPCPLHDCAVYGKESGLPAPPFLLMV